MSSLNPMLNLEAQSQLNPKRRERYITNVRYLSDGIMRERDFLIGNDDERESLLRLIYWATVHKVELRINSN